MSILDTARLRECGTLLLTGYPLQKMPANFARASGTPEVLMAPIFSSDPLFDRHYGSINQVGDRIGARLYEEEWEMSDEEVLARFGSRIGLRLQIGHFLQGLKAVVERGILGPELESLCRFYGYVPTFMGQFQKALAIWDPEHKAFKLYSLRLGEFPDTQGLDRWIGPTYLLSEGPVIGGR